MISKYDIEYMGVKCTEVEWNEPIYTIFHFVKDGKTYHFTSRKHYDCSADTDHIRCVIEEEFLPYWKDEHIKQLETENAELKVRLEKAVELPCKVGDTIYEVTSVGIYEWEVESVYLNTKIFQANCVNKNDCRMHWNFIKADYCNEFEGKGRVRVNRLEAEARLAELGGANAD